MSINKTYLGYNAERLETAPAFAPYSKVIAWYDDENAFVAGDDRGRVLEVDLPMATQDIVDGMLERIRGYRYQPYYGTRAILDPAAELGDGVTVNGVYSVLASIESTFDAFMLSDVAAPADEEVDHEYHFEPPVNRALRRKVTLGADYHGVSVTRAEGLVVTQYDDEGMPHSRAQLNGDIFAMYDDRGVARLYFDPETGRYKFVGDLDISGGSINMSGGSIQWGENYPKQDTDLPEYLHSTYIDETMIYSPSIYGGSFYATDGSDLYAKMSESAFELLRDGDDVPRASLSADVNMVELALGVGTDESGENGRMYVRKSYGSVNGSSTQNFGLIQYRNTDGRDSGLALLDNGNVELFAAGGKGFTLSGNSCKVYTDRNGIVLDAGIVIMRVDNNNQSVNFFFKYNEDMEEVNKTIRVTSAGVLK